MTDPVQKKRTWDWWIYLALLLIVMHAAAFFGVYQRFGEISLGLWYVGQGMSPGAAEVLLLVGLAWSLWKRPFLQRARAVSFAGLLAVYLTPNLIRTYPSSHDNAPSKVHFRVPFDGPVTVGWGGPTEEVNYHVIAPDQRWAYDLFMTKNGKPNQGDGSKLTDFFCYGRPVLAPADGVVRRVDDGHPESPPGRMGGEPPGGNQVMIEVGPKEYLFLCHMQPRSIRVKPGQRVNQGETIGLAGNSGNTSMPHLHIHLQDTPEDDWGEGIPLEFYHYRSGDRVVEHGIPHGGDKPEIIEQAHN